MLCYCQRLTHDTPATAGCSALPQTQVTAAWQSSMQAANACLTCSSTPSLQLAELICPLYV